MTSTSNTNNLLNSSEAAVECGICYDELNSSKNNCSTTCGHTFCMSCFIKATKQNNCCPLCRNELYPEEKNEDEDEDEEDDEDDETLSELTGEDEDDDEYTVYSIDEDGPTIEAVSHRLYNSGMTYEDLVTILYPYLKSHNPTRDNDYRAKLTRTADNMVTNMEKEFVENNNMEKEDRNVLTPPVIRAVNIVIPRPKYQQI